MQSHALYDTLDICKLNPSLQQLVLTDGQAIPYDKLCICSGATPKVIMIALLHLMALLNAWDSVSHPVHTNPHINDKQDQKVLMCQCYRCLDIMLLHAHFEYTCSCEHLVSVIINSKPWT